MKSVVTISSPKQLLFCVFILIGVKGISQSLTLNGYVLNENNAPVSNASVFVNSKLILPRTDETGLFELKVQINDTVIVQKDRAKDQFIVSEGLASDSILVVFQLFNKSLLLNDVTITRSRVKKFDGELNEHLLDYFIYENGSYLTLKKAGNAHFLEYQGDQFKKSRFKLNFQPEELYIDCQGNSLIVSADTVYQFWMDQELHFSNTMIRREFENTVKNLVYCGDSIFVDYNYTDMNKRYHLNYYDKDTSYSFFTVFDSIAFYTINEQLSAFHAQTCPNPKILPNIPLKYQYIVTSQNRGAFNSGGRSSLPKLEFIALQINNALNIQSMRVNQNIVSVDFDKNLIHVFNKTGKTVHTARLEGEKYERNQLIRDPYTNRFYVIDPNRPALVVSSLDLENGNLEEILVLKDVFYPEKVKIFNNQLYFIAANSNDFQKVFIIQLPD